MTKYLSSDIISMKGIAICYYLLPFKVSLRHRLALLPYRQLLHRTNNHEERQETA